jgi:hypothetical protein
MAEFDHGIKLITDRSARELARAAGLRCGRLTPLEGTLPATTELLADRAFRASRGRERFVVYFEFYTRWDRHAPWDMLAKSGLLSQRLRLPAVCLAFVLLPQGFRSQGGQLRLEAAGGPTQQLWFREVCLWQMEPAGWWEGVPGLMTLYPLCRHGRTPPDAIRHAAEAIGRAADTAQRADNLALLQIFGQLAFPQLEVAEMIRIDDLKGTKTVRRWMAEAWREAIADVVRTRFGEDAASAVLPLLERVEDPEQLRGQHEQAVRCATLDEFSAGLATPPRPRRRTRSGSR